MKQALVTGGTRGIGAGVARLLASAGWSVVAASVAQAELEGFKPQDGITVQLLDVTDQASVDAVFSGLSGLDALVNCAGILVRGAEYEIDVFTKVLDVNLTGTMRCCLAAHPLLKRNGGAIVNTASMLSTFGGPLVPAYSASKGGVAQLTKALAGKWAEDGIRVNAIAPGWIQTPLTQPLADDPAISKSLIDRTPMNRWGKPEDVVGPALFLCSPLASFITGAILPVDGGYSIA